MITCGATNANQKAGTWNFGQDSSFSGRRTPQANGAYDFFYAPPTGYQAICTKEIYFDLNLKKTLMFLLILVLVVVTPKLLQVLQAVLISYGLNVEATLSNTYWLMISEGEIIT